MLSASPSRRHETLAGRTFPRSGAAQDALNGFGFRLRFPCRHGIARRDCRGVTRRSPVLIRRLCPVQREDRDGAAEQQSGDGLEIIPASQLRRALVAEIALSQAETRLHRIPAFSAEVGLVEDDFHSRAAPICPEYSTSPGLDSRLHTAL